MSSIIIAKENPHDPDKPKNCADFVPLNDGTRRGDRKYCDLSHECMQIGMLGEFHEYYEFYTDAEGKVHREPVLDYLCTGNRPIWEERSEDSKAT